MLIPCNEINVTPQPSSNMIGGIPSRKDFINTLHELYCYPNLREDAARKVRLHAENERFSWRRIGERWSEVLMDIVAPTSVSFAGPSVALLGGAGPEKV